MEEKVGEEISVLRLDLQFSFGANFVQKESGRYLTRSLLVLEHLDQTKLIYPVGRQIGIRSIGLSRSMDFFHTTDQGKEITGINLSEINSSAPAAKRYLAVNERKSSDGSLWITIYDVKNFKVAKSIINISEIAYGGHSSYQQKQPHGVAKEELVKQSSKSGGVAPSQNEELKAQSKIVSLSFSRDTKNLAVVLSDQDGETKALIYDWQSKNKIVALQDFADTVVTKMTFSPKDWQIVCTSGPSHWKVWRVQENSFKQLAQFQKIKQEGKQYTDHCWLDDDKLVVGTRQGELILLDNYEQKQYIDNAFNTSSQLKGMSPEEALSQPTIGVALIKPFAKGFFIASESGHMALWVRSEENNSTTGKQAFDFIRMWQPAATKNIKILSLDCSSSANEDYLAISLENNNIGIIQIKSIGLNEDLEKEIKFDLVCKGFHSGQISQIDMAVQRPLIITCSKQDSTIRLWNYKTFTCEMAREYYVLEDQSIREAAKPLISVAIHPSGYYMAASFIDKIRFHHILHDEFKHYKNIEIKYCKAMKFSHGGHLFACIEELNIQILQSYTLEKMKTITMNAPKDSLMNQIIFNEKDSALAVTSHGGYIGRWALPSFEVVSEAVLDSNLSYSSHDFVYDESQADHNVIALAGSQKDQTGYTDKHTLKVLKVINSSSVTLKSLYIYEGLDALGSFSNVKYVNLNSQTQGFIATSDEGEIYLFSDSKYERLVEQISAHYGPIQSVCVSPHNQQLITIGKDGAIFIFNISDQVLNTKDKTLKKVMNTTDEAQRGEDKRNQGQDQKIEAQKGDDRKVLDKKNEAQKGDDKKNQGFEKKHKIVDPELADIVLVKRNEISEWQQRQKKLKYDLALTKKKVEMKLRECKIRFEKQYHEIEKQKDLDIKDLQKRYDDLNSQKQIQDKQNQRAMAKMQGNHLNSVEEIHQIYEKKLYVQGSNYLSLEQSKLETKKSYENKIEQLKQTNKESIEKLLAEFKLNLNKVQEEFEESKATAQNLRAQYEKRLTNMDVEHEEEVERMKAKHRETKSNLQEIWRGLEEKQTAAKNIRKKLEEEKYKAIEQMKLAKKDKKIKKRKLEETTKQISLLQQARQENVDKLTKREKDLYKYKFKIQDLEKSKNVLTHRTTEMKASLQPKETQIETQNQKLLELKDEFAKQKAEMDECGEQLTKNQSKINQLQQDLIYQQLKTEDKQKIILKFAQDVYQIVQNGDEKSYKRGLMQLNQNYVMSEDAYMELGKKKDVEEIEVLDRELRYMERSIATLKINAIKHEERDKNEIKKKTKENTSLVVELNSIKFEEKMLKSAIQAQDNLIKELEQELTQQKRSLAQDLSLAKTTAQMVLQTHGINTGSIKDVNNLDEYADQKDDQTGAKQQKGQGNLFLKKKENLEDKARILELIHQLEENNQQIFIHKLEIRSLKDQVIKLLEEKNFQTNDNPTAGLKMQPIGSVARLKQSMNVSLLGPSASKNNKSLVS